MGYPWGISGPDFLRLYIAAVVVVVGFAVLIRVRVRRPSVAPPAQRVGVLELAFLAGGPRRVVETALSRLIDAGAVRPARDGWVSAVEGAFAADPVETVVLREIGAKPRSVGRVLSRASTNKAVTRIGDGLVEQGLLVRPASARAVRGRPVLALVVLLAIGVARLVTGVSGGHPVGYLVGLLVVTVALIVVLRVWKVPARTVHGDRVLASARAPRAGIDPWLDPVAAMALGGTLGAVALGGLALYPDLAVRQALVTNMAVATSGSGSGSTWWYDSGSGSSYSSHSSCGSSSSSSSSDGGASCGGGSSCGGGGGGGCGGGCGSG